MANGREITHEPVATVLAGKIDASVLKSANGHTWRLSVTRLNPFKPRTGWYYIAVAITDESGQPSRSPLMEGIVSGGGRGVMPWFECRMFPQIEMAGGITMDARAQGLEAAMIDLMGLLVPAGGHLMIDYETSGQAETHAELLLRVPPEATHLGALMFRAGFRGEFKDWYFSEGGHEGPRKLQANKSPNTQAARAAMSNHVASLRDFLKRALPERAEDAEAIVRAQMRARALLEEFGGARSGQHRRRPDNKRPRPPLGQLPSGRSRVRGNSRARKG